MNNRKQHIKYKSHNFQQGLSLLELLISVTLGAFLLMGVVTNFIATKSSDKTRAALSEMDANGRMALNVLRQTIQHAGYQSINNVRLEVPFYTPKDGTSTNPVCSNGTLRDEITLDSGLQTTDGTGDRPKDIITVVTLADNPCKAGFTTCKSNAQANPNALVYYDCLGGGAARENSRVTACSTDPKVGMQDPTQAKIYSSFFIKKNTTTLFCQGSRSSYAHAIVDNIVSMQFLYGVKKEDGTTAFLKANVVNDRDQWGYITSVQVALLMRSSSNILKEPSDKTSYNLLDAKINIKSEDLRRLFRVYTSTINLENRNKGALL